MLNPLPARFNDHLQLSLHLTERRKHQLAHKLAISHQLQQDRTQARLPGLYRQLHLWSFVKTAAACSGLRLSILETG